MVLEEVIQRTDGWQLHAIDNLGERTAAKSNRSDVSIPPVIFRCSHFRLMCSVPSRLSAMYNSTVERAIVVQRSAQWQ